MQLGLRRELIETVVIVEFFLIIAMIVSTYLFKYVGYVREKRKQKLIGIIENHLTSLISSNQPLNVKKFRRRWKKIQILYPMLVKFDKTYSNTPAWQKLRQDFLQLILLPLARRRAYSRRWAIRFFSCETLGIASEAQDEKIILKLLKDRIPLVYLHAISTAIKAKSEAAINAIIARTAKMSWLTQAMYLEPFEHAPIEIRAFVERRLISASEPIIRAECYKILRKFPPVEISWDINKDL